MRKLRSLCVLCACVMMLLSCDRVYPVKLCNGYGIPIVVTLLFQDGFKYSLTIPSNSEYALAGNVTKTSKGEYEVRTADGKIISGVGVSSTSEQTLANYSTGDALARLFASGLNFTPRWLLTEKGLFQVPSEFEETWREHIQDIEKNAVRSFPSR